jgi:hypothetical protein
LEGVDFTGSEPGERLHVPHRRPPGLDLRGGGEERVALGAVERLDVLLAHPGLGDELEGAAELVGGVLDDQAVIHGGVQDHPQGGVHDADRVRAVGLEFPRRGTP